MNLRQKIIRAGLPAVLVLSGILGGCTVPGKSIFKTNTEQSLISWSTGNYEDAISYAQKALRDNPQDPYAMMVAGLSYDSLGYPNQSRRYYEDVLLMDTQAQGVFSAVKSMPAEDLKKGAMERLNLMEVSKRPFAQVNPVTQVAVFTDEAFPAAQPAIQQIKTTEKGKVPEIKGGFDMLSEGDRNVIMRFLIFKKLRDERYVTEEEWERRRAVNLGGLLPYTMTPAALGMDLPSPGAEVIIGRFDALRKALEMRAITPREHAAEREIILEALLPSNPFYRMDPTVPPQDILEGATALRRIEMLKAKGLITPSEAKKELEAIEKLTYAKIGMLNGGKHDYEAAKCIRKCLAPKATACPSVVKKSAPVKKKIKKKIVRKPVVKKTVARKPVVQNVCKPCQ